MLIQMGAEQACTLGGSCRAAAPTSNPPLPLKIKLKNYRFCRLSDINVLHDLCFT